jgi:hypothetical protein
MKPMNEVTQLLLAKMIEESEILMAEMVSMDPLARVWLEMYHERIGKEVMATQPAAAASAPSIHLPALAYMTTSTSTSMAAPAPMPPPASANEVPHVVADEEDIVEVQPPMTPFV